MGFRQQARVANPLILLPSTMGYTGIVVLRYITKPVDNNFDEIRNWFNSSMGNGVMEGIGSVIQAVKNRVGG